MSTFHTHSISSSPQKRPSTVLWKLFGLTLSGIYASRPELTNINYIENLRLKSFYAGLSRKFPYFLTLTLSLDFLRGGGWAETTQFYINYILILSCLIIPELSWHEFWFELDCSLWSRQIDFCMLCGLTEPMPEAIRCSLSQCTWDWQQLCSIRWIAYRVAPHRTAYINIFASSLSLSFFKTIFHLIKFWHFSLPHRCDWFRQNSSLSEVSAFEFRALFSAHEADEMKMSKKLGSLLCSKMLALQTLRKQFFSTQQHIMNFYYVPWKEKGKKS